MTDLPRRVFVVEDEAIVAFEMSDALEDMGFEVVGPSIHLDHAKQIALEGDIDAAILDVNLGRGKTSKPVVEILRERGIPYAFITAYDENEISFINPSDRVVKKPVTGKLLLETLSHIYPNE